MIRSLVLGAVLAASSLGAHAVERRYDWTFTGFITENLWFSKGRTLSGYFVVDDVNGNGTYDMSMVREFWVEGIDFAACPLSTATYCDFSDFSYQSGGALNFNVYIGNEYEPYGYEGFYAATGDVWRRDASGWGTEPYYNINWWSDETQFSIVAAPVPEPHTYMMMGAGLAALLGIARRRRRPRTS